MSSSCSLNIDYMSETAVFLPCLFSGGRASNENNGLCKDMVGCVSNGTSLSAILGSVCLSEGQTHMSSVLWRFWLLMWATP